MALSEKNPAFKSTKRFERYLSLSPQEKEKWLGALSRKGLTFDDWHARVTTPVKLDKEHYTVNEAAEIARIKPGSLRNKLDTSIFGVTFKTIKIGGERRIPRQTLSEYFSAASRAVSLEKIIRDLHAKGVKMTREDILSLAKEDGAILQGEQGKTYDIHALERVMDKAWKRVHTVEDLAKELNMYHSMAWTLLKRTFGDKYGATGKIFIEPEDYQQLTSFPEVREYAADKNVPPERVAEVIESLKKTKGKQKSKGLINRAKTLILLEHLGFTPGTPEHSFLFKRKIGHEKLERHAELLTSLGVTNLAAFRHYLLKPHDYLKKPETKKAIKKCQSLLTLEEVREYAKKKNTPQEKTAQIIGVLEEEMRKRKIDSLVGKGAIRKLYRFNARGKKIVLLEHLGIQPHQPAYGLFFGNKSSAETMEKKAETLKELGVTDFYKFRFYLYSGRINLEDPKVVSLVRKRLNPTSATPAFDETSIAHDEIGKLMQKANSGNNEAFNKLIATFTPFIKKTAGELFDRKTGPSFEDLQAFGELGVYNAVRSIKHLTNPKAYLFSAIKNTMRRCIREERTSTTSIFQPIESKKLLAEGTKQ